jgi:hypothetical protein
MTTFHNLGLYEVVRSFYNELLAAFAGEDLHSEKFLSSFPYSFIHERPERKQRIVETALAPDFKKGAEDAIAAYYSDHGGGDLEFYICDAVEDFLNFVIPRTAGLPEVNVLFDRYYGAFDSSIYGKTCLVTVFAILEDIWDNSGSAVLPSGFRLRYVSSGFGRSDSTYTRERTVPYFEIRKAARPIGRGRDLGGINVYLLLEYTTHIPKDRDAIQAAYTLFHEVARKFVFAARITLYSTAYSDYRGFRMLGHLSAHSMIIFNSPDDRIERGEGRELEQSSSVGLDKLVNKLMQTPFSKVAVIDQKVEDAIRRRRSVILNDRLAQIRDDIDKLLDYFQVLEAIVPAEGSQYISLYAARLLASSGHGGFAANPFEIFKFIKDMHTIRNNVIHGRVDEVISGRLKDKLDIPRLRQIIYSLAGLYVLNGGALRESATRLALGEQVALETAYGMPPAGWTSYIRAAPERNQNLVFW